VLERINNIAAGRTPIFAHSCGDRPYRPPEGRPTVHLETSPYTIASAAYEKAVGEPLGWTRPTLASSRFLRRMFADDLNTSELLPTIGRELLDQRILKTLMRPIFKREE
jgi:hypothetical protein